MKTLKEINNGCKNCTMPLISLCPKCTQEFKRTLKKLYGVKQ